MFGDDDDAVVNSVVLPCEMKLSLSHSRESMVHRRYAESQAAARTTITCNEERADLTRGSRQLL